MKFVNQLFITLIFEILLLTILNTNFASNRKQVIHIKYNKRTLARRNFSSAFGDLESVFIKDKKVDKQNSLNNNINSKLGIDFGHLINNDFYRKFLNKTKPILKKLIYSKPFAAILSNAVSRFPKQKTKAMAELEIDKLRKLSTEQAADYFANLKINSTQDYWYNYYLLSKVALKGRINRTNQLAEEWDLPDPSEHDSDFVDDSFYLKLKAKENFYLSKLKKCKNKTLTQIKDHIHNYTIYRKKNEIQNKMRYWSHLDEYYGQIHNPKVFDFSDLKISGLLIDFIKNNSKFFKKIETHLPKGIIHHIHLTASFNSLNGAITNTFASENSTDKNPIAKGEFISLVLHEEDKIKKGEFSSKQNPKVFFIEDFKEVINSSTPELEKLFKDNFMLPRGECVVTTEKTRSVPIDANLKAFYYFLFCKGFLYSNRFEELRKIAIDKKLFPSERDYKARFDSLSRLGVRLSFRGNILESHSIQEMPKSKSDLSFSLEDHLSNAIWDKFESIFGMYQNLFDHPVFMKEMLRILASIFARQKIYGVEFRQKYDKGKVNSKYAGIKEAFGKEEILTSFILPGRKVVNGNGLKTNIREIRKIKEIEGNKADDVSGIDFVGYEDDPFTGARNFFSNTILRKTNNFKNTAGVLNVKENWSFENKVTNNDNNFVKDEFDLLFDSLKNGNKFYPHAGETLFLPDYPIDEKFMDKLYINDNLIHSALLPNVERLGHGFAVINNGLLATIVKKKNIGLENCPVSNHLLYYHKVYENPGLKLLRHGLKVAISPDDPGFFGYMGVAMDWFQLIMQTDIKASEIYMMLKNSILKASPNINKQKEVLIPRLQQDLEAFFENLDCEFSEEDRKKLIMDDSNIDLREWFINEKKIKTEHYIYFNKLLKYVKDNYLLLNMYSKNLIIKEALNLSNN